MTVFRAVAVTAGFACGGAAVGAGIGFALGMFSPDYYVAWFPGAIDRGLTR